MRGGELARHIGVRVAILQARLLHLQLLDAGDVLGHLQLGDQVDLLGEERLTGAGQALHAHAARRRREGFRQHFVGAAQLERRDGKQGDVKTKWMGIKYLILDNRQLRNYHLTRNWGLVYVLQIMTGRI